MPTSTSSKISVGTPATPDSAVWIARLMRDSSPPDATLASGPGGRPGWLATRKLDVLQPVRARLAHRLQPNIEVAAGQRQFVHRRGHLLRQRGGGLAAQRAELLRLAPGSAPRRRLRCLQRIEIVAGGQLGQPRLKLLQQTGQRVRLHAMLARQPVHVAQAGGRARASRSGSRFRLSA